MIVSCLLFDWILAISRPVSFLFGVEVEQSGHNI
jgi:hypothetical protein